MRTPYGGEHLPRLSFAEPTAACPGEAQVNEKVCTMCIDQCDGRSGNAVRYSSQDGRLAQLVRAPALQAGGRRFESCTAHHSSSCLSIGYGEVEPFSCSSCFWLCPKLCPPSRSTAAKIASSDGCTYLADIVIELCPAILASVQVSQPLCPSRVRNVWRRL